MIRLSTGDRQDGGLHPPYACWTGHLFQGRFSDGRAAPAVSRVLHCAALERRLGRPLAPGKPGPKPRVDGDTGREPPLL
jgi:hypothetical protein